ncbi:MAG: NlpC/P60 family protein [Daejeonella sp.]
MSVKIQVCLSAIILCIGFSSCKSKKIITDSSKFRNRTLKSGSVKERYSAILNVNEREIDNEKLYRFIDNWMGIPHKMGGTDKSGVDCSGFTNILEREIYNVETARTAREMAGQIKRKYENELKEGDLVFFDFDGQKFSHVGIYLKNNKFVHVSSSKGVIISDLKDPWYYKYFSRAGSVKP